jgi:RecA-family ATPase
MPTLNSYQLARLEAKAPEYVIDKILEKDTMCMVFGSSAAGKTFAVIDMLCCISTGLEFHGYEVKVRGTCIYICGEGHNGLARRFDAWALTNKTDISRAPVYVSETSAKFCTDDFTNEV